MLNDSGLKFSDYLVMLNHAPDTNPGSFQYCFRVSFLKNCRSGFQPRFHIVPSPLRGEGQGEGVTFH